MLPPVRFPSLFSSRASVYACGQYRWTDHHDPKEYIEASRMLVQFGRGRCVPLRMTFREALPLFKDGSLDFCYVDGYAAGGQENGQTLEDWWPKLRPGGIFGGHDYDSKWPATQKAVHAFRLPLEVANVGT